MDTTAKLRALLGQRKQRNFVVDVALDDEIQAQLSAARKRLAELRDPEGEVEDSDRRASQPDAIQAAEGLVAELTLRAEETTLSVEFLVADARVYEGVLLKHPNAETSPEDRRDFADELMRTCYIGCKLGGSPVEPTPVFDELMESLALSYMELDEWRTKLLLECMSAPHRLGTRAGHR